MADGLPDCRVRDRLRELGAHFSSREVPSGDRLPSGAVFEVVPLAICAAATSRERPFLEVLGGVIRFGGDTDTLAALTGQLLAAVRGAERLRAEVPAVESAIAPERAVFERFAARFSGSAG